ncbi:MAG TPA: TonB-dependent receptor [Candidatus Acidoferrum sp.]|nr:TonB-dependent receptor [Candidatus Acidoferrum sp.]
MKRLVLAILVILSFGVAANAQTFRGAINGTVTDPSGAAVPNAAVKATEAATGFNHTTVTTSEGQFSFQDIALGLYKVTVTATGFPSYVVDKVEVSAGQIYTLQVKLQMQQQTTTVEVSAAALTLETTNTTQSTDLTSGQVQDVPLNGRDFTQLITIQPGFGGYNVGGFGSVNGTRPNQVNWQIDGVDNNDFWHNIPAVNQGGVSGIAGIILPVDSIDEFSAQTQSGSEGGRNAGGTVNVVTKSGGNTIHGSVYYYNRNEAFAAHSPFFTPSSTTPKAPPLRNQNYGMSFGGPIRKEKLFYFVSYEKQQYLIGVSGIATEPSDAWITLAQDLLNNPGAKYGTYAAVPQSTFSTAAIQPSGFWPRGSVAGSISLLPATPNNYFAPVASIGYSYNGVGRADYKINSKHQLYLRFFGGQGNQIAPLGASPALGTASSNLKYYFESAPIHVFNYSLVANSALTTSWTNQLLVGINYFNQVFSDANHGFNTQTMCGSSAPTCLFLSPDATNKGQYIVGAPNISISGFEQIGLTPPEGRNDITWHVSDIVSHTIAAHQLRFGGELRQAHVNEFYHRRGTGKFTFDGTSGPWAATCKGTTATSGPSGCQALFNSGQLGDALPLADFLAGDVASSTIAVGKGIGPARYVVVNAFNLYFQDSWQVTKKLNLNFGLRYEYFGPLHGDGRKDLANFIPGPGLMIQGSGLDSLFNPDKNNFAPRFGFAYQPGYGGYAKDLVVRGAFGVFYDQINMNPFLDFRPPITAAQGIEGNPIGPDAVSTFSAPFCGTLANGTFQWDAVQQATCPAGYSIPSGANNSTKSVFGPALVCADPLCAKDTNGNAIANGLNLFAVNHNFRTPYFYNYSLQVEKGLGNKAVFQIGYVGSEGRKLNIVSNINQGNAVSAHFGSILQLNSAGTSNYNSLQSTLRIREWHGLTTQFAYTWGHALDEISEYRAVILDDAFNRKRDYANGDYDTRHSLAASLTYVFPKAQWAAAGWKNYVVNGWQASSIWKFNTGQPYDEVLSGLYQVGDPFKGVSHSFDKTIPGVQWINAAAFSAPCVLSATITSCPAGVGTDPLGNVSRNKYFGPGFATVDTSVFKNIPITERFKVQLRAEMFNLFNRKNLANSVGAVANSPCHPTLDPTAANPFLCTTAKGFGQVTDTAGDFQGAPGIGPGEPFNLQLAIKVIF